MAVKRTALGKRKRTPPVSMSSKKLQAQVKRLMRMKQEKKYAEKAVTGVVGQVSSGATGILSKDITPTIAQGDGEGQRIGNSITGTGLVVKQQFIKQVNGVGPRRVRTLVIRCLDPSLSEADVINGVLDVNPLSTVRDYFSALNYTMMSDKRLSILGQAETKLVVDRPRDNGDPMIPDEQSTADLTIPVKFDDQTIRYTADGDSVPASIRYFMLTMCDIGNSSTSAAGGMPIFVTTASSGVLSKAYSRLWYTDS